MISQKKIEEIRNVGCVAVVLASSIGAIAVVRALGKEKIPVIVIGFDYHHKSIYTTVALKAKTKREVENLLFLIPELLNMKPVLFTDADEYLNIILSNWDRLDNTYYIPASDKNYNLINKENIEKIKDINNVTALPISFQTINEIEDKHYPVIIKPLLHSSDFSKLEIVPEKAYICKNEIQVKDTQNFLESLNISYVVQQLIEGDTDTIFTVLIYRSRSGEVRVGYTAKKLRVFPLKFGLASAVISEINPETVSQSIAIMECADYQGIAEFEYKFCEKTNRYFLIEVNGRFPLQTSLLARNNSQFIYSVFKDLINRPFDDVISKKNAPNVIWIFSLNDIRAIRAELKELTLNINLKMCLTSQIQCALWSNKDPLPSIYYLKYIANLLYKKRQVKNQQSEIKKYFR